MTTAGPASKRAKRHLVKSTRRKTDRLTAVTLSLLRSRRRLPSIVSLGVLLIPLSMHLGRWLAFNLPAPLEMTQNALPVTAMALASAPTLVIVALTNPPEARAGVLSGISMALRGFGIVVGVIGLANFCGRLTMSPLEAAIVDNAGVAVGGGVLWASMMWVGRLGNTLKRQDKSPTGS